MTAEAQSRIKINHLLEKDGLAVSYLRRPACQTSPGFDRVDRLSPGVTTEV